MRMLMTLAWKILVRLLRHLGWGVLLVPVAAMGMALYGVNLWTVTAVLLALILVIRRPAAADGLLPAAMAGMGICGLVKAAGTPGASVGWAAPPFSLWLSGRVNPFFLPARLSGGPPMAARDLDGRMAVVTWRAGRLRAMAAHAARQAHACRACPGQGAHLAIAHPSTAHNAGFWPGRLAVPVALLLLTLGLWLAPRALAMVRPRAAKLAPYLRRRIRESRWGILLVPVAAMGLPVFGVHPWTAAVIAAALAAAFLWPAIAADLVPVALAGFAIYGFVLAARWQSLPMGVHRPGVLYGAVLVGSRQMALLAGAEASVFVVFAAWLLPRTVGAHARALLALGPDPELAGRVQRLTETRGHAVDAATSELRRIERDLHDGAQARLVALGMNLRAVERMLPDRPQAALALVAEARETSVRALNDLRDLIRGIYPPVLADRGLGHAVRALALDTPVPTDLDIDLPGRLSAPVESACYFAVAEVLANAVKHASARCVHVRIQHAAGVLRIEVADDGAGGADPARGTGLLGVERRLGTFDGILAVNSPLGGPTMIVMEVPCVLSSPKTCSC
jgi:signal transduction histidine kinase